MILMLNNQRNLRPTSSKHYLHHFHYPNCCRETLAALSPAEVVTHGTWQEPPAGDAPVVPPQVTQVFIQESLTSPAGSGRTCRETRKYNMTELWQGGITADTGTVWQFHYTIRALLTDSSLNSQVPIQLIDVTPKMHIVIYVIKVYLENQ